MDTFDKLDRVDLQILRTLQENARLTTKELAARVSLSSTPVFERLKRLESGGYIKKYIAVLDAEKLNLMFWKIYMVSSRKEEFVTAAKKELQPYLTKKDEKQIDTTYDTIYNIDRMYDKCQNGIN